MEQLSTYLIERKKLSEASDLSIPDLIQAKYSPNLEVITSIKRKDGEKFNLEDAIFIGKYLKDCAGYANESGILYNSDTIEGKLSIPVKLIYSTE